MTFLDAAIEAVEVVADEFAFLGKEAAGEIKELGRHRIAVQSSAIAALTYHPDHSLVIEFNDGTRYVIPSFPPIELSRWLAAKSIGAYFNANVRGRY